eukprot:TRINITY_DN3914_c0_g3_i2.p2 TRINITY_DN3914_c0_g3~~TRINITY_DN3914_c0_g3_i2.p2  ORF type:complete len:112 (-),score=1.82 TRINITY_DN3914_c0_g3_i2:252-587(-)
MPPRHRGYEGMFEIYMGINQVTQNQCFLQAFFYFCKEWISWGLKGAERFCKNIYAKSLYLYDQLEQISIQQGFVVKIIQLRWIIIKKKKVIKIFFGSCYYYCFQNCLIVYL